MLYRSDINSHPSDQLSIVNDMDGHVGQAHMRLAQPISASKLRFSQLLLGFGVLLPPREFRGSAGVDDEPAFHKFKTVSPDSFNAHYLSSFVGLAIKWVDNLACHLEYDSYTNTLYLFRYPSFCLANIVSHSTDSSVLYRCAASTGGLG